MKHVLVLDDEVDICLLLALQIRQMGDVEVRCTHSLAEFRAALEHFVPDMVLLDVNLPDGSGLSVVPQLREGHPGCEVVIISAYGSLLEGPEVEDLNLRHFVPKPFSNNQLMDLLQELLHGSEAPAANTNSEKS